MWRYFKCNCFLTFYTCGMFNLWLAFPLTKGTRSAHPIEVLRPTTPSQYHEHKRTCGMCLAKCTNSTWWKMLLAAIIHQASATSVEMGKTDASGSKKWHFACFTFSSPSPFQLSLTKSLSNSLKPCFKSFASVRSPNVGMHYRSWKCEELSEREQQRQQQKKITRTLAPIVRWWTEVFVQVQEIEIIIEMNLSTQMD